MTGITQRHHKVPSEDAYFFIQEVASLEAAVQLMGCFTPVAPHLTLINMQKKQAVLASLGKVCNHISETCD